MPTRNVVRVPRHAIGSNGVVKGAVFPKLASVPSSDELAASGIKLGITTTAKKKDSPAASDLIAHGGGDGGGSETAALPNKEGVVHNDEKNAVVVVISEAASDTSSSAADHHAILRKNFDSALEMKYAKSINTDNAVDGGGNGDNTMNQTLSAVEKMSEEVSCDHKRDHPPTAINNNVAEGEGTTLPNTFVHGHPILSRQNVTPIRGGSNAGGSLPPKRDDDVAEVTSAAAAESRRKRFMMNADSRSENNMKKARTENTQDTSSNPKPPHRYDDGIIIPYSDSPNLPPDYTINPKSEAFDITVDPYAEFRWKSKYQQTPLKNKYLSSESVGITARDIFEEEQAAKAAAKGERTPVAPVNVNMIPYNAAASMAIGMLPSLAPQPNPPKQQNQAMATPTETKPVESTSKGPMPQPTQQQAPQQMPQNMPQQFPQGQAYWPGMPMPGMMGVQPGMQAMGVVSGGGMSAVPPPKQQNQAMATSTASSKPSQNQPMPQQTPQQQVTQQAPPQMPQQTQQQAPQQMPQQFPQGQAYWPGMPMPGMMGVQPGMQAMGGVPGAGENGVKPGMPGGGYPMIPMYGMFPHHHMGPQSFGMFPAPCVPFQPMPGQPSSNVAQPPPTQPQLQKNESQLPSREETPEEERRRKMKEAIKECTMRPFFGSTAPSTDDTTPSSATITEPNSPVSPIPALPTIKKNTMLSQI